MASAADDTPADQPIPSATVEESLHESSLRSTLRTISTDSHQEVGDEEDEDDCEESSSKRTKVNDDMEQGDDNEPPGAVAAPIILDYPTNIETPSRDFIESVFDEAALEKLGGEQSLLADFDLLSFQDVLLPVVARLEERAVKEMQMIVQRDNPELSSAVMTCRKAIMDSATAGGKAAERARQERLLVEQEREQVWAEEQRMKELEEQHLKEKRAKEERQMEDMRRQLAMNDARKNLPYNQDIYRETAYLLSELPKLQKEMKAWEQAEVELKQREAEMDALEAALDEKEAAGSEGIAADTMSSDDMPIQEVEAAIQLVKSSSLQIQILLENVSNIANESDKVRKKLYRQYRQEHQFHGYQGATDPKGLLFVLSQSQQSSQDSQDPYM